MVLVRGEQLAEGKTKIIYAVKDDANLCIVYSKDRITAHNAARANELEGKAQVSTRTAASVFGLLTDAGIRNHFVRQESEREFVAERCAMIPIEWVTRRIATGSFLKRNYNVKEGFRFTPVKRETFYKDDANNDPEWSLQDVISAEMVAGGVAITAQHVDMMSRTSECVFEILERAWASIDCALIDMKIEFGVNSKGEVILADIIDADSWRLWPAGDRRLMKDKQVYRDMAEVTPEALQQVKRNFEWIADKLELLLPAPKCRAVVIMGSPSDKAWAEKIAACCQKFGVPAVCRVSSAHKSTEGTLAIVSHYEGDGVPTVFIAVAGRSNGLGPVISGNTVYPVINCPPPSENWGAQDIWSSLRMPSGLGCSTTLNADGAAAAAAQIFALSDHRIWSKLRARQLNTTLDLMVADKNLVESFS
ncbi:multifunctional protein ADE2-like [Watersipora subatra]|uniref:multifunctional protein ADE2-like n=1 Tax=Watersipora subatra TaxID=2589382 RepID=UPI00355B69CE